jgi:uncharacterized protein (TIGR02145 family)
MKRLVIFLTIAFFCLSGCKENESTAPEVSADGNPCPGIPTITYAGKVYNTVQIGSQCWLKENLDIGTMLQGNQNSNNNGTIEKYCYNDDPANCTKYGGLYQWGEAMAYNTIPGTKGICPDGFHIPTFTELQTLTTAVSGSGLTAIGEGTGDRAGTNTSGFSALLAGLRSNDGNFYSLGVETLFQGTLEGVTAEAFNIRLGVGSGFNDDKSGFSVRCIKDQSFPPKTPILFSPSDGEKGLSVNPTLSWNASSSATSYYLQVSTNSSFSSYIFDQSILLPVTSQTLSGLNNNTKYYWRVSATNSYGTSSYSTIWSFTTR